MMCVLYTKTCGGEGERVWSIRKCLMIKSVDKQQRRWSAQSVQCTLTHTAAFTFYIIYRTYREGMMIMMMMMVI